MHASEERGSYRLHAFAAHVASIVPGLAAVEKACPARDPDPLQSYVLGPLAGGAAPPLLDGMTLAAAVRLCETAGAVAVHGAHVDLKRLSDADRHFAGDRGFEGSQAARAPSGSFLDRLMVATGPRERLDRPQVAFGRLFTLLK